MTIDSPKRSHLPALRALWQEAFGDGEEFLNAFAQTAFATDRCRCLVLDDTVAAALYWFDCSYQDQSIAYLYAIATTRSHRGRGLCSSLMEDTHRHLKTLGYAGAVLVPGSKELFSFYEKFGYRVCSHVSEIRCAASASTVAVRQIDTEEYAALRRRLLPQGGILQEHENLKFLQTQATLYAGDGFLLAARRETERLYGVELLGDPLTAPALVGTLGCTAGRFRTPGNEIPFAMYRPLRDGASVSPTYFGLAFD
ncbi:MAG: GNAT family N-acetyltransferase [Clostridia bacterium]|nr:GNAT family N-acetyltransferase [Clostridia bacterium]